MKRGIVDIATSRSISYLLIMLETPHVFVGAAIAAKIGNPLLAIPLALASHFVLDQIPHWNPHFYTETQKYGKPTKKSTSFAVIDLGLAGLSSIGLALMALPNVGSAALIFVCCLVSILPDLVKSPFFFLNLRPKFMKAYVAFERSLQVDISFVPGMITQFAVIFASLMWIFN